MPFIVLQTFKIKFFLENLLWNNILNHLKTKLTLQNLLFFHFLEHSPKELRVLTNVFFFSFGLADDQISFINVCNHTFFSFLSSHYAFLNYSNCLNCSVFFLLITLQFQTIKYHCCGICISNKNKALKTIKFSFSAIQKNFLRSKF